MSTHAKSPSLLDKFYDTVKPASLVVRRSTKRLRDARKLMKRIKGNKEFYQKNAIATSVVSALILNSCVGTLMTDAINGVSSDKYNGPTLALFCVCVSEGLSLLFGNILLLMPNNPSSIGGPSTDWVWQQCFIWMLVFMALGILMLVAVMGSTGQPSQGSGILIAPLLVFGYCAGSLAYHKLKVMSVAVAVVDSSVPVSAGVESPSGSDLESVLSETDGEVEEEEEELEEEEEEEVEEVEVV